MNTLQPTREELLAAAVARGFKYSDSTIHIFAGGSNQHGAKLPGKGDLDICGIYLEPAEIALGIDREEHFVTSTGDSESRNTSDDRDFSMYTLRKWASLAAKGNPTVLSYLFMPPALSSPWLQIVKNVGAFLASSHAKNFIGFGRGQLRRLHGQGTGKHGQRNDVIAEHGYDTKWAMHMLRMMYEGTELMQIGRMTFPSPEAQFLIEVRLGKFTIEEVTAMYHDLEAKLITAEEHSELPRHIDRQAVSKLITQIYLDEWRPDFDPMDC